MQRFKKGYLSFKFMGIKRDTLRNGLALVGIGASLASSMFGYNVGSSYAALNPNNGHKAGLESVLEVEDSTRRCVANEEYSHLRKYEEEIISTVNYFNERLGPLVPLDPCYVVGMLQTETGATWHRDNEFLTDPLQIKKDFGEYVFDNRLDDMPYIEEKVGSDFMESASTLQKSIAFLYEKALETKVIPVETGEVFSVIVQKGDTSADIARNGGSTLETLEKYNPEVDLDNIKPGDRLEVRGARLETVAKRWIPWDQTIVNYNGNGVDDYLSRVTNAHTDITRS